MKTKKTSIKTIDDYEVEKNEKASIQIAKSKIYVAGRIRTCAPKGNLISRQTP